MSLWKIAWRSIQQRGLASVLTAASMALGVMLVVTVLSIHGLIAKSFRDNASFGYNLIVGPKGGSLQLTMNSVYYLSQPIENIPYDYYLDLLEPKARDGEYKNSIQRHAYDANWETAFESPLLRGPDGHVSGLAAAGEQILLDSLQRTTASRWSYQQFFVQKAGRPPIGALEIGRDTSFGGFVEFAIPLCLGDYFGRFRVVGTKPAMFDQLQYGERTDKHYEFASGRNFREWTEENGYFEAVVGATVARERKLAVGDRIAPSHGAEEGTEHAQKFTVVGVLKPTGTPQDRGVFINMEGFFLMEDHAKPLESGPPAAKTPASSDTAGKQPAANAIQFAPQPLPIEQREVTAVLVSTLKQNFAMFMENSINEGTVGQAVLPVREIYGLFDTIVAPVQLALLGLTVMICIVSGVSILVSIYNSMNDRRHEIAVMRALGAGRGTVMSVILMESVMLSLLGGMLGWGSGHVMMGLLGPSIESRTGVSVGVFDMTPRSIDLAEVLGAKPKVLTRVLGIGWIGLAVAGVAILGMTLMAALGAMLTRRTLWEHLPLCGAVGVLLLLAAAAARSALDGRASPEILIVPALIVLAVTVGFLPALTAYRTDVAKSLGK